MSVKQDITKYFVEIYLKMTFYFSDYCCSSFVNENTLAIERRNTFQKQPPKDVSQIYVWQLLLKSFNNVCEGVKFLEKLK